jgi:hypothetical protein
MGFSWLRILLDEGSNETSGSITSGNALIG